MFKEGNVMIVIKVYTTNNIAGNAIPLSLEDDKCYCDHNLNGIDELVFELQRSDPNHSYILEEVKVKAFGNIFIIKKIDEHSDFSTIKCEIDLDDWKAKINKNFRTVNSIISEVLSVIVPSGWSIVYGTGVDLTKRTTVEKQEGVPFIAVTSYDLLDYISKAYSVVFNFNAVSKTINVVNIKSYTSSGEFFMQDLNMTELGYNGDSSNFVTRVYAYGKDGLTFASINDGKEYVENTTYSNKIVSYVIIDDRYTVKANLLAYANQVLAEKCFPVKSYTCKIQNLNADIWLYKVVTIVDKDRKLKVEHQCVKYREYNNHSLDSITLSTQSPSIEKIVKNNNSAIVDSMDQQRAAILDVLDDSIKQATDMITGTDGGHFRWIIDNDGKLQELVNLADSEDINTAQKVWRWNAGGLGHSNNGYAGPYDLALTADGKINASMIDTGTLLAALIIANTLIIGGQSNGDGNITIKDATGHIIITIDKNGLHGFNASNKEITTVNGDGLTMTAGSVKVTTTPNAQYGTYDSTYGSISWSDYPGFTAINYGSGNVVNTQYAVFPVSNRVHEQAYGRYWQKDIILKTAGETGYGTDGILYSFLVNSSGFKFARAYWEDQGYRMSLTSSGGILFNTPTLKMWLTSSELTIGANSNTGTQRLRITTSDGYINGHLVAYQSSSSKRYKHGINHVLTGDRDPHRLLKLSVAEFVFNDDRILQYADMKGETLPGFIAEEVDEIYPSATIHNPDTGMIENWDERRIIPGMLALIQEQAKKIEELESRIAVLELR